MTATEIFGIGISQIFPDSQLLLYTTHNVVPTTRFWRWWAAQKRDT